MNPSANHITVQKTRAWEKVLVCFLNPGGIGEVILQTPFYEAIKELHPSCRLTVLVHKNTCETLENNPRIDELITYTSAKELSAVFLRLHGTVFDQCFILDKTWKSIYPVRFGIRAREYRGFKRREWEALPLTEAIEYTGNRHETSFYLQLLDEPDAFCDPHRYIPKIYPTKNDVETVNRLFPRTDSREWICLAAGGAANQSIGDDWFRRWPARHYASLAARLIDRGFNILLVGGPSDRYINNIILNGIGRSQRDRVCDLTAQCSIVQSGLAMGRTRLVITNDSGIMHLAACFNSNLLCLFGPTSPVTVLPKVENARYLWDDSAVYCHRVRVYGTRVIDDCLKSKYFKTLTVDRVQESIEAMLSGKSGGNAIQIRSAQCAQPAPEVPKKKAARGRKKTAKAKFILVSPFTSVSGSAVRFWNIAQNLQNRGCDVVYVERKPKDAPAPALTHIRHLSSPKLKNLFLDILLSTVFNIGVLVRHINCSVFYALKPAPNNCIPALLAKAMGKTVILDIDDLDFGYIEPGFKREVSRFFFNFFPRYFKLITCHTPSLQEYITRNSRVPPEKIYFLTQGLSDVFLPFRLSDRPSHIPKSIVYLATLGITSDFGDILPMFAGLCRAHPDLHIKIIGDGVRKAFFANRVEQLGMKSNVQFLGWIEHQSIPQVMAANWIGLAYMRPTFTNKCRAILKIREYLGVGLQVVCNNTGDAYLFRDHIYIEENIAMMEKRLLTLLAQGMVVNEAGRRFIEERFRWQHIIDQLLDRMQRLRDTSGTA